MSIRTVRPFHALFVAALALACAPEADFHGGGALPDTLGPDADVQDDAGETTPGEVADASAATCETDDDCKETWKDVAFPCHTPACGEGGVCEWQADQDQDPCDDHNDCTENDACLDGQCVGDPLICAQGTNPCVATVCERGKGCTATRNTIAPCDDGDTCTVGDTCADGTCKAGDPLTCNDDNVCTSDECKEGGCKFTPLAGPCDDGNPCTLNDACEGGACAAAGWNPCDDLADQACQRKVCDPVEGCTYEPLPDGDPCDDGNACTLGDYCVGGTCTGPIDRPCVDADPCTLDGCKPSAGCWFQQVETNGACDDGDPCTTGETCQGGVCKGTAVVCNDDDPCTVDFCDPLGGGCAAEPLDGLACSDGNPCTLGDTCKGGVCKSGLSLPCDDGNPCTTDSCGQVGGTPSCTFVPTTVAKTCDDGNPCTNPGGPDLCEPGKGTCTGGTPKVCNDGNPCTVDFCNPKTGDCLFATVADDTPCSSDDLCLENQRCLDGACSGDPLPCDDGDLCTTDSCDPDSGCVHDPAVPDVEAAGCATLGLCAGKVAATCAANTVTCDYAAVDGYEADGEATCDGRDNDCDGTTDEGLCGVCGPHDRLCAGDDVLACTASGLGWELERTCAAGSTCVGAGTCLAASAVAAVTGVDPDPARSHALTIDADGRLLVAVPLLDQGAPSMTLQRVLPDTLEAETLATLGDVSVVAMVTTADRHVHVVTQAAAGANLDLRVISYDGGTQQGTVLSPVKGFQAVAAPLVQGGSTLAVPVATINPGGQLELRVDALDLGLGTTSPLGGLPYTGYLVKRLVASRQIDGDLALVYTTNTQKAFLSRFRFASGDFEAPQELPDDPFPVTLAAAPTSDWLALFSHDAAGTVSVAVRSVADLAVAGSAFVGTTAEPSGRVRAWGRGQDVLALWEGGTVAAPELGATLVGSGAVLEAAPVPDGLAGFDPRYGQSPLGFEWISWRTAAGEIRFLAL